MLEKTIYYQLARKVNSIEGNIPSTKIEDVDKKYVMLLILRLIQRLKILKINTRLY